ncbi:hypothetical protein M3231_25410 [Neobacillus mesonae]|nr:hypothetical protein [Neobacillus mesonae]
MSTQIQIYKVSADLKKDQIKISTIPWKLLIETNRYYEIREGSGPVKRLYKEKLNTIIYETKSYANASIACSAFCSEEDITRMKNEMIKELGHIIDSYIHELRINQKAVQECLPKDICLG